MYKVIGILLGLLFLYLSVRGIDFEELMQAFEQANWNWMLLFFLLLILFFSIKTVRWHYLLLPKGNIPSRNLFPSMICGVAVNYLAFAYVGEFVRALFLSKQAPLSKSTILGSIVLERLFDLCAILIFLAISFYFSTHEMAEMKIMSLFALGLLVFVSLIVTSLLIWTAPLINFLSNIFPQKWIRQIKLAIHGFHAAASAHLILKIALASLLMWFVLGSMNWVVMRSLGIDVPLYAAFLTMALLVFGIFLPNSPGHIGMVEFCYVYSLHLWGIDPANAFAAGLTFHACLYFPVILTGIYFSRYYGVSLVHVQREIEER